MLDPTKDEYVKLGEEITDRYPNGGGKITEHRYNAKTSTYEPVVFEIKADAQGQWKRTELQHGTKHVANQVQSQQETTYDSVNAIHGFVTDKIGLPFVFDTASGMAVWNYPVEFVRVDREKETEKVEDGKKFTYTTYKLDYTTMGGPGGESRYIIKRNEKGEHVRSVAVDPMPDFAFRNEKWVCAPVAEDARGEPGVQRHGVQRGLSDRCGEAEDRARAVEAAGRAPLRGAQRQDGEGQRLRLRRRQGPDGQLRQQGRLRCRRRR